MRRKRLSLIAPLPLAALVAGLVWLVYAPVRQERLNRALIAAIKQNDTKTALALLDAGADPNSRDEPPQHLSLWRLLLDKLQGKQPPPSLAPTALLLACSWNGENERKIKPSDNATLVRALLDRGVAMEARDNRTWGGGHIYGPNAMNRTPLLWATLLEKTDVSILLIEKGANVNVIDAEGVTPLMLAARHNNKVLVGLLLNRGADVNAIKHIGQLLLTPLVMAQLAKGDDPTITEILLSRGAKINEPAAWTPLHQAIMHDRPKTARVLLHHGARAVFKMHSDYFTIQMAKEINDPTIIQWLKQAGYQSN